MNAMSDPRRRTFGELLAIVLAGTLAAVAGVGLGRVAAPEESQQPSPSAVSVGPARVLVPSGWDPAPMGSTDVPGLDAERAFAFETTPGLSEWGVILFSRTTEPSLIPAELRKELQGPLPAPARTRLAGSPAWKYRGLATGRPDVRADVTVLPTTAGVLAVICTSGLTLSGNDLCAGDVESVTVRGARVLLPSPSLPLQQALPAVLDDLDRARLEDRAKLSAARTPEGQALAAGRLAADHRASARAIRAAAGSAGTPLARDLDAVAHGYDALREQAETGSRSGFAAARGAVDDAETVLQGDVRAVGQPAPAPVSRTAAAPASEPSGGLRSGVAPVVFALLIALALAVGGAAGSSGATSRLWQRIGVGSRLGIARPWNSRR
jgi:hypothetical protein